MTSPIPSCNESLSALMDGELRTLTHSVPVADLLSAPQTRETWHAYHVLGDVLRSEALSTATADLQFLAKLEARLAQEPVRQNTTIATPVIPAAAAVAHSANASFFGWRSVAGAACTVALAALGALLWAPQSSPSRTQMAQTSASTVPAVATLSPSQGAVDMAVGPDGMLRDPRLDQLLVAHQQLGGHSALQMPAGFLRNATYEGAGR